MKIQVDSIINEIMENAEKEKIGMIATHIGIVKGINEGKRVKSMKVYFYRDKLSRIIEDVKKREGIMEVKVKVNEGELSAGEWIMVVMIAGEKRDIVFSALIDAVERIKKEATKKEEVYGNGECG